MLDKNKFKYFVADKGIQLNILAAKMGISPATLSRKLAGLSEFTRQEIQVYQSVTGVTDSEMMTIFFR